MKSLINTIDKLLNTGREDDPGSLENDIEDDPGSLENVINDIEDVIGLEPTDHLFFNHDNLNNDIRHEINRRING